MGSIFALLGCWTHWQAPPFSIQLLKQHAVAGQGERDRLLALLPALYLKEFDDLAAVGQHVTACVEEELACGGSLASTGGSGSRVCPCRRVL